MKKVLLKKNNMKFSFIHGSQFKTSLLNENNGKLLLIVTQLSWIHQYV